MVASHFFSEPFNSKFAVSTEEESSGKWLVPIPFDDLDEIWDAIIKAVGRHEFVAVKKSAKPLDNILGHHLVCVYSTGSTRAEVEVVLQRLRAIGVKGPLTYKTDKATASGRDDKLWTSEDIENGLRLWPTKA